MMWPLFSWGTNEMSLILSMVCPFFVISTYLGMIIINETTLMKVGTCFWLGILPMLMFASIGAYMAWNTYSELSFCKKLFFFPVLFLNIALALILILALVVTFLEWVP
jgi:hypothetical protein